MKVTVKQIKIYRLIIIYVNLYFKRALILKCYNQKQFFINQKLHLKNYILLQLFSKFDSVQQSLNKKISNLKNMHNQDFLAEFGQDIGIGLGQRKISNNSNTGDFLSGFLSVTKEKKQTKSQNISNVKKKEDEIQHSHEYFKKALKPIKPLQKPKLFAPKEQDKEIKYQQKIKEAKSVLQSQTKQKKYKPKVVDYLNVGSWDNFKRQGNDKPKSSSSKLPNTSKQQGKQQKKRKQSYDQQKSSSQRQKHKQKNKQKHHDSRKIVEQERSKRYENLKQQSRRQKQKLRDKQRQKSKEKQRQRSRDKQRQKHRSSIQQKSSSDKIRQKQRERQKQQRQKQRQRKQRQQQRQRRHRQQNKKHHHHHKHDHEHKRKHKDRDQDQYQDDGFVVDDDQQCVDWQKDLNRLLNKKERQRVYEKRDRQQIVQSSAHQILGQDRISARFGRQEEQADWRRQEQQRQRKLEKRRRQQQRQKKHRH